MDRKPSPVYFYVGFHPLCWRWGDMRLDVGTMIAIGPLRLSWRLR